MYGKKPIPYPSQTNFLITLLLLTPINIPMYKAYTLEELSFLIELYLVNVDWLQAVNGWITPSIPENSLPVIMSVLGAVVMPHNLFLHSEVIQSRQWNLEDVETLEQTQSILSPLLGKSAAAIFALALLFSGFSSTSTAGMAAGSIFAGIYREPYNIRDVHTRWGVFITYACALLIIFFITNPLSGLMISQIMLSVQLPFTILLQIYLTSSSKVMGKYANTRPMIVILMIIAIIVTFLNLWLLVDVLAS